MRVRRGHPRRRTAASRITAAASAAVAAVAAAATATAAHADTAVPGPTVAVDSACYVRTTAAAPRMHLTGSGFTPGGPVTITDGTGTLDATTTVGATGAIDATFAGPGLILKRPGQVRDTITVSERTAPGTHTVARTTTHISILGAAHGATGSGRGLSALRNRTNWTFSGWPPGRPIYVHYLLHHRPVATARFGRASGPCGTLQVRRALFPTRPRASSYATQIDTAPTYRTRSRPRLTTLRVGLQFEF